MHKSQTNMNGSKPFLTTYFNQYIMYLLWAPPSQFVDSYRALAGVEALRHLAATSHKVIQCLQTDSYQQGLELHCQQFMSTQAKYMDWSETRRGPA